MKRSGWPALLLAASVALLFFDLGSRVLATNDETRFPMLARDILARGDWLRPYLNDQPYLNKPPLYAWLIALASWPAGTVTQASAPVVSLLAALGVIGVTYWIGRRLFDSDVGLMAGLIALTTHGVFTLARAPMPDMVLCLVFTAAMAAFVSSEGVQPSSSRGRCTAPNPRPSLPPGKLGGRASRFLGILARLAFGCASQCGPRSNGRHSQGALVGFYLLVGVAFWTKGPAGLLPLAVVLVYALVAHGLRGLRGLASAPGLALLGLAIALWWALGATAGREQFTHGVVARDLVGWYLWSAAIRRSLLAPIAQPFEILLPWTVLLPVALWAALRTSTSLRRVRNAPPTSASLWGVPRSATDASPRSVGDSSTVATAADSVGRHILLLLVWTAVVWALVALSSQQRMRYYLPLVPPAALLIALWWRQLPRRRAAAAFACVWVVGTALLVGWHVRVAARANAATDLRAITRETRATAAAIYAVDAPELVLAFYLERRVTGLRPDRSLEDYIREAHDGYLIISDRLLPASANGLPRRRVADGRISGREVVVLARE